MDSSDNALPADDSRRRIPEALLYAAAYPHPAADIRLIETHISWVLLAGDFAYKLKKPVDLGFLDFSRLARRKHFCEEELRLNRRLAPSLYLDVVTLRETAHGLRFGDSGEVVEYAVRMRRFPQQAQLDRQLGQGGLVENDMDPIADLIGGFHRAAAVAPAAAPWGTPMAVAAPALENFAQLQDIFDDPVVTMLRHWTEQNYPRLALRFAFRRATGFVRECHGDLHLRNMARIDSQYLAFDGIEFEPALRWIDIISDAAFLFMDLQSRDHPRLAWRFLNRWLMVTGDYAGLDLLDWYVVYRHMVRAKVDGIRLGQTGLAEEEAGHLRRRIHHHLALAHAVTMPRTPALIMTWGLSGSGKSWLARHLAPVLPGVIVRSDVERKRMFGAGRKDAATDQGIYSSKASDLTYRRLRELAGKVLTSGHHVIVDASFLDPARRVPFVELANHLRVPHLFLRCEADPATLRDRVLARARDGDDPSDAGPAVLAAQQQRFGDLAPDANAVTIRTDYKVDIDRFGDEIRERLARAGP